MKEYGIDLQKQYQKLIKDELILCSKIKKRREFLLKNATQEVLKNTGIKFIDTNDTLQMLNEIIAIEKSYTSQSIQLDMFS